MEADPGECQDEAESPQHQAVQLDDPSQGGDAGTVKFEDEALLPFPCRGREVIKILLSFITERRDILIVSRTLMGQTKFGSKHIEGLCLRQIRIFPVAVRISRSAVVCHFVLSFKFQFHFFTN